MKVNKPPFRGKKRDINGRLTPEYLKHSREYQKEYHRNKSKDKNEFFKLILG